MEEVEPLHNNADKEASVEGSNASAPDLVAEKRKKMAPSPSKAEKKAASTGFFGNIFGGPKANAQVEESVKGTAQDDCEPCDVTLEPDSHTVNTDTEWNEHQDTAVVDINSPEEKHSDLTDEERSTPIHTEGQKSTASVIIEEGNAIQDYADQEAEVAVSAAQVEESASVMKGTTEMILSLVMLR